MKRLHSGSHMNKVVKHLHETALRKKTQTIYKCMAMARSNPDSRRYYVLWGDMAV